MTTANPPAGTPARNCDLVLKGGITSGIVYPLALVELSEAFTFRNIGGTSAGAIAAAAAAAAELGGRNVPGVGFEKLRTLPDELGRGDKLFSLFQPQEGTAALYSVATAFLQRGTVAKLRALVAAAIDGYSAWLLAGAALPAALLWLTSGLAPGAARWVGWAIVVAVAAITIPLGFVAGVIRDLFRLPANNYGLCKGYDPAEDPRRPGLVNWLIAELDALTGRPNTGEPLTLADLYGRDAQGRVHTGGKRLVNLEMMTTNITHGRPYSLPFLDAGFYFEPGEMREYFPESVVSWMMKHPPRTARSTEAKELRAASRTLPDGRTVHPIPEAEDLPVIVMTRLSLSFPGLFAAVPLYAVDYRRVNAAVDAPPPGEDPPPERCWFSDGGICSNLPIHFFDALIPRWPTFAIDLRDFDRFRPRDEQNEANNIFMPSTNVQGRSEWWNRFEEDGRGRPVSGHTRVAGFIFAIIDSARGWRENVQARVAGYRDRVATVKVGEGEGGLNLAMDERVLRSLVKRGELAGELIRTRYTQTPANDTGVSWPNHRWVRYRNAMSALQAVLGGARHAMQDPAPGDEPWPSLISREHRSYAWNEADGDLISATEALIDTVDRWEAAGMDFSKGAPTPVPELRPTPRV